MTSKDKHSQHKATRPSVAMCSKKTNQEINAKHGQSNDSKRTSKQRTAKLIGIFSGFRREHNHSRSSTIRNEAPPNFLKYLATALTVLLFISATACEPRSKVIISETSPILTKISTDTPKEVKAYSKFSQFVNVGLQFRLDYTESFMIVAQNEAASQSTQKSSKNPFMVMQEVFANYASQNNFLRLDIIKSFPIESNKTSVKKNLQDIDDKIAFIKELYENPSKEGNTTRYIGALETIVTAHNSIADIAKNRLKEISGAKRSGIQNGGAQLFEKINFLASLEMTLKLQQSAFKNRLEELGKKTTKKESPELFTVILAVQQVAQKRKFYNCPLLDTALLDTPIPNKNSNYCGILNQINRGLKTLTATAQKDRHGISREEITPINNNINTLANVIKERLKHLGAQTYF